MAKTVDNFATIEDFRTTYNDLAYDVGDVSGLRDALKSGNNGTLVDAVNVLEDKQFFFQEFVYVSTTNQVTFTGNDSFTNKMIFVKDKIQVFKNTDHLIEDVDFIIASPTGTGAHEAITLTGTYASGQANAMASGDRLTVYSYTGAFVGTNIANSVASFFIKTIENTIYNSNANGVILNGDSSSPTTLLESGYTIQLAGRTFSEDDVTLTTGKTLTAPIITDNTATLQSGSITGAVNGTFSGFLDIEGNIDVNGTSNLDNVDIDGTADISSTLTVHGNTDLNANLTVDGNTTLGNAASDTITFTGYAASHLRPDTTNAYTLGLSSKRWSNVYSNASNVSGTATVGTLFDGTLSITGGDITSVDDITGGTNSIFMSGTSRVNNIKAFNDDAVILDTTVDHSGSASGGSLTGTVSTLSNHSTATLSEDASATVSSGTMYYTDARVLSKINITNIDALSNVNNSSLANDDVLLYNGSAWANTNMQERVEDIAGAMFSGNTETGLSVTYNDATGKTNLVVANSDFALTGAVTGSVTQTAKGNVSITTTPNFNINDNLDVNITSLTDDDILKYDSASSKWKNVDHSDTVHALVGNMVTSNTETGIAVTYQSADNTLDFVVPNSNFTLSGAVTGSVTQTAKGNVSISTTMNSAISNLTDVSTSTPSNNQVLAWSGSSWAPVDQSTNTSQVTEHADGGKYFTDDRVNAVIVAGSGLAKTYVDNPDGGTDTDIDGQTTINIGVGSQGGVKANTNDIELDYSVITDSDLSGGLPSGTGKSVGHLFFLV
jgi:hypothetical protein